MSLSNEIRALCSGHPYAKIPWPHRPLHELANKAERLEAAHEERLDACMTALQVLDEVFLGGRVDLEADSSITRAYQKLQRIISKSGKMQLKPYAIHVATHHEPVIVTAPTRGNAYYQAYLRYREVAKMQLPDFLAASRIEELPTLPGADGYDYIRETYRIDVRIGQRCRIEGMEGVVVYPGPTANHLHVLPDGGQAPVPVHPLDAELNPLDLEAGAEETREEALAL